MTPRLAIEHFHLAFSRLLCAGPDRADFAIKGGCNLRFFFGSMRYSEDLDLDVQRVPLATLRNRVDRLLGSTALQHPLKSRGITIASVSSPKQMETTQRWKATIQVDGAASPLHTKIEFSRRQGIKGARVEAIDRSFALEHGQQPLVLPHYPVDVAIAQKVLALVGRTLVQARDVFDLSVLFARAGKDAGRALSAVPSRLESAIARAMELTFEDFNGQVVAYLSPDDAAHYSDPAAWEALQLGVVAELERARARA